MDTQFIPSEILNNVNIDMNDTNRLKELNDTFKEILKEENIKNSKDYKNLIVEINERIDSEMKVKKIKEYSLQKSKELEKAKKELNYLQSLVKK
tara:strand:- start:182 stop:463 length:282 start_codon:yes stop_codon:yes gene_type:complete